ncbi:MAG TPA: hypothetical protein VMU93_12895 [Caulobacteraceae bacterium]|nr:hypothetical protein [Caulobacteraceae bacterium]
MRQLLSALVLAAVLMAAQGVRAAPAVEIRNAVARVVVSPEPRADIEVEVVRADPRLPLRIWRFAGRTFIDGGLGRRVRTCSTQNGEPSAKVAGVGVVAYQAMPQVIVHTPLQARVYVMGGDAVWGRVGRSQTLDFANAGCGEWRLGDVSGRMKVSVAGAGGVRAGQASEAELYADGAGSILAGAVAHGVYAMNLGSGQIQIASVSGPFTARIAGAGSVRAAEGRVSTMQAEVAGSGGISFDGVAGALTASVHGSGDVTVARVTGPVRKAIVGSGTVRVGS